MYNLKNILLKVLSSVFVLLQKTLYLWKKLVLLGDLVKHLVGLDGRFQISSQNLREKNTKTITPLANVSSGCKRNSR